MDKYYVDAKKDEQDEYKVHSSYCSLVPRIDHIELLGLIEDGLTAVKEAEKQGFYPAKSCSHCLEAVTAS